MSSLLLKEEPLKLREKIKVELLKNDKEGLATEKQTFEESTKDVSNLTTNKKQKIDIVVAAFIVDKNKILLIHHKKLQKWLPPGGHIKQGETPEQAIAREIKEETGLDIEFELKQEIKTGLMKTIMPFHMNLHSVGDHLHYCLYYLCKPKKESSMLSPNREEITEAKWFDYSELDDSVVIKDVSEIGKLALDINKDILGRIDILLGESL